MRVGVPRRHHPGVANGDGVTAGVWVRVMDAVGGMTVHLLSVFAVLNEFGTPIEMRVQPVDTARGRLTLYLQGERVRSNSTSTILVPLRKWLHVSIAVTPSTSTCGTLWSISVAVHNILMHTVALVDYDPVQIRQLQLDNGADDGDSYAEENTSDEHAGAGNVHSMHPYTPTLVTVGSHGGTVDVVELRVYRAGLSAHESRAIALAVHVLDPIGSRELGP